VEPTGPFVGMNQAQNSTAKVCQNCYSCSMNKDAIIALLRASEAALRARGVTHAALFGSRARGEAKPESDIDIMVEIAPEAELGVFEYIGIVHMIEDLFPAPVDVSDRRALKPHVRPAAERDAVYAF
jgi:uncharacterized protein